MKSVKKLAYLEFIKKYQNEEITEYPNTVLDKSTTPKVSVRISTYNHIEFIRDCLDGVLMQETKFPVEILIGEDESSDGTRDICIEYAKENPEKIRLFLHSRKNNIAVNNQATGIFQNTWTYFQARGEYIAECEGDDYWTDPLKLQKQVDFLDYNLDYVICSHPYYNYDQEKNLNLGLSKGKAVTFTRVYRNIIKEFPNTYFNSICSDSYIMFMLKMHGKVITLTNIQPGIRRIHSGGLMSKKNAKIALFDTINTQHMLILAFPENKESIKKVIMNIIIRYYKQKKVISSGFLQFYFFKELIEEKILIMFLLLTFKKKVRSMYKNIRRVHKLKN